MTREVRWGVLGAARIAAERALPALCSRPGGRPYAVAARDRARAAALGDRFGAHRAYGAYDQLLADPDVDAVYVALPNALHAEWILAALDRGKPVLCEKPLALLGADARRIATRADETGLPVADGFMYRFHPQADRLFELVSAGAVGTPWLARGALSFQLIDARDIRADPGLGGGALADLGCYVVDALCRLHGGPARRAGGSRVLGPTGVDEVTAVTLEFPGGRLGGVEASFRLPWTESAFEVRGDEGTLRAPHLFNPGRSQPSVTLTRPGAGPEQYTAPSTDTFAAMFGAFEAAVRGERPYPFSVSEAVAVAESLELAAAVPA